MQKNKTLLHVPKLSALDFGVVRAPGPGLGNLLFPIARALIGCEHYGGEFVYPTMRQIKVGPLLRGEKDARTYGGILRPRTSDEWRLWFKSKTKRFVYEREFLGKTEDLAVIYEGLGGRFHDIAGKAEMIRHWLYMSRCRDEALVTPYDIALHVRLGDFTDGASHLSTHNVRQEIDWFRAAFDSVQGEAGNNRLSVRLFTDGDVVAVSNALKIVNLQVDSSISALNAILNLSQAKTVITSRSTFSMWGVFLGNTRAVWDSRFGLEVSFPWRQGLDIRY